MKKLFSDITNQAVLSRALHVAANLAISDHLISKPLSIDLLSQITASHLPSLERLMAYLIAKGFYTKTKQGFYSNNELSDFIRSDHPHSVRTYLLMQNKYRWDAFGELGYSIKTGLPSFDHLYGYDFFTHLKNLPEQNELFDSYMQKLSEEEDLLLAKILPLKGVVADIGGGKGHLLRQILSSQPKVTKGILFDQSQVVANSNDGLEIHPGDFFHKINVIADCYLLKRVLHDWSDEKSCTILKNVHSTMPSQSTLFVIEIVLDQSPDIEQALENDLRLFTVYGGKERTFAQFQELARQTDFTIENCYHAAKLMHVMEWKSRSLHLD